jgi:hypothetical protein
LKIVTGDQAPNTFFELCFILSKLECPLNCSKPLVEIFIYQVENGVLAFENGVLAFENEVLAF